MRHEAIRVLYANVVTIDDTAGAFDKDGIKVTIDEDAVTAKANELAVANAYIGKRAAEYPSFADQFDKIYHDGIDEWKKVIKAVKDKYPKGD